MGLKIVTNDLSWRESLLVISQLHKPLVGPDYMVLDNKSKEAKGVLSKLPSDAKRKQVVIPTKSYINDDILF